MSTPWWARRLPLAFALSVMVIYVVSARGLGNVYPVSTFEMYGGSTMRAASRIVARSESGEAVELRTYSRWRCDRFVDPAPQACLASWPYDHQPSVDERAAAAINRAPKPVAETVRVEVVRRIWRLHPDEPEPSVSDCVLARCEASP